MLQRESLSHLQHLHLNLRLCGCVWLKADQTGSVYMCMFLFPPGLLTLCGVTLYISYSHQALAETESQEGKEGLEMVHTSFGWSLGLACLSYGLEVLISALLLIAARLAMLGQRSLAHTPDRNPHTALREGT